MAVILSSCYISRTIEGPATLRIEQSAPVQVKKPEFPKYILHSTEQEYMRAFEKELQKELESMGVTVVTDMNTPVDFILTIDKFILGEIMEYTKVDDEKSTYHGQSYVLHSCYASTDFTLYNRGEKISTGWASVDKDEKLSNKRNVGDYIFGSNKDNTEYRHKGLQDDVCVDLAERCGRRTAARITKKISKFAKKNQKAS